MYYHWTYSDLNSHLALDDTSQDAQIRREGIRAKFEKDVEKAPQEMVSQNAGQAGVSKVEAFNKVLYHSGKSGKLLLITLVNFIGLTMFAYALDQGITCQFNTMAASSLSMHAELGAVNTASQII